MKIVFLCEGNICRSPTAEAVFLSLLASSPLPKEEFVVSSRALIRETTGQGIHGKAAAVLKKHNIPLPEHKAKQLTRQEYDSADLILYMDQYNGVLLKRLFFLPKLPAKAHLLLEYAKEKRDILDPYPDGDFEKAYEDIEAGCKGLIKDFVDRLNLGICF
jgi:protein-tyrosine phosphatase